MLCSIWLSKVNPSRYTQHNNGLYFLNLVSGSSFPVRPRSFYVGAGGFEQEAVMSRSRKKPNQAHTASLFDTPAAKSQTAPDFGGLLAHPLLKVALPRDFDLTTESDHLVRLWNEVPALQRYRFDAFVHAGGSGMVFRIVDDTNTSRALKIAREKLFRLHDGHNVARSLSPVSQEELRALERINHPNVVQLYDVIEHNIGVVAICTSYIPKPQGLDLYLEDTLSKRPRRGHPFSPERLDDACLFLLRRCQEVASALQHMHSLNIYHLDIKPANILLGANHEAILTDLGACQHAEGLDSGREIRVHFTWTYAHPNLTSMVSDPQGITGEGLKTSALGRVGDLPRYDLFAFGKTIQECLAKLEAEFGGRSHAAYAFRFLHIIACLLLDGRNAPEADRQWAQIVQRDGRRFVADVALEYEPEIFGRHKISSVKELVDRLARFDQKYSWDEIAPELDIWRREVINIVIHSPAPFTERVSKTFNHPALRRLKSEPQLGWIREIYPGATHDRWSHSLGVFSALVGFYNALLSDPEVPTLRILIDTEDVSHAFVAAMLHDLAQTAFGHDLEEVVPFLYSHDTLAARLLDEHHWGGVPLRKTLEQYWPKIDLIRVMRIMRGVRDRSDRPIDGVASDAVRGPIDADKLDYLLRDAIACGVTYGHGIAIQRFMRALTVTSVSETEGPRLALAYKAKGRPAIASVLLARYQMFGAVYWHHTFRCIQAMFGHAASVTFREIRGGPKRIRNVTFDAKTVTSLLYERVLLHKPWEQCSKAVQDRANPVSARFFTTAPPLVRTEPVLDFVWQFADLPIRQLIERLAKRELYKRAYELRLGQLGERADYSAMKNELAPDRRVDMARDLQTKLFDSIDSAMRRRGPRGTSISENEARRRLAELRDIQVPLVLLDFPVRGVTSDYNMPVEIGDALRKYFTMPPTETITEDNVFLLSESFRNTWQRCASSSTRDCTS